MPHTTRLESGPFAGQLNIWPWDPEHQNTTLNPPELVAAYEAYAEEIAANLSVSTDKAREIIFSGFGPNNFWYASRESFDASTHFYRNLLRDHFHVATLLDRCIERNQRLKALCTYALAARDGQYLTLRD